MRADCGQDVAATEVPGRLDVVQVEHGAAASRGDLFPIGRAPEVLDHGEVVGRAIGGSAAIRRAPKRSTSGGRGGAAGGRYGLGVPGELDVRWSTQPGGMSTELGCGTRWRRRCKDRARYSTRRLKGRRRGERVGRFGGDEEGALGVQP